MNPILIYLGIGLIAGFLSGLVGIGGGIVLVPLLITFAGMQQLSAQGTSIGILLLPVGILAAMKYWQIGAVNFKAVLLIAPALTLAAWAGAAVASRLPAPWLEKTFGSLLILVGLKFILGK